MKETTKTHEARSPELVLQAQQEKQEKELRDALTRAFDSCDSRCGGNVAIGALHDLANDLIVLGRAVDNDSGLTQEHLLDALWRIAMRALGAAELGLREELEHRRREQVVKQGEPS